MTGQILEEALAGLEAALDHGLRWSGLVTQLRDLGIDQVNYAVLDLQTGTREEAGVIQYSSMDPTWIGHYLDRRLDLHDPHVRFVRERGFNPYRFSAEMGERLEDRREADVIAQAAEAGLRSQISVVFPDLLGNPDPIGGMTLGSSLPEDEFVRRFAGQEMALLTIGTMFHERSLGEVRGNQHGAKALTPRERDCLTLLAQGKRTARIAERLKIADSTVELHLRNARRKLKAKTAAQAVARALLFGEIAL
ncbi:LuxR family transcriptional regulator [Novosphingobium sp.]|uniref:helix-turn-helix transcriptional regulator n=1 Tax=Novosphingobium sp. TaxID=1874826 RepID=UPI001EC71FE8|nr:LuxR family transcriptional regulator [Novosphingobium sp.]MBK9010497.1 autoinducer binding domain-containing protein [Novosphingobium sp.]